MDTSAEKNGTLFITKLNRNGREQIVSAFYEDGRAVELSCTQSRQGPLLGNIYVGKVKNILSNIEAAFVEIGSGVLGYYSLKENKAPVFTNGKKKGKLSPGDELLVQVSREAVKTKAPTLTSSLNFPGKYLVLTTERKQLGLSSKLSPAERLRLKALAEPFLTEDYGIIVRTNAAGASEEELKEELELLSAACRKTLTFGTHYTPFSLVYQEIPPYAAGIRSLPKDRLARIITDDAELYSSLEAFLSSKQPKDRDKLVLYREERPSLDSVYGITHALECALKERVWLKSGAYLVIQPTEALTVIDVNTGKYDGHKKAADTFRKINREAAQEIARQLRLRNLSGIIVADFIDMENPKDREDLMEVLDRALKQDPVRTVLVDMTPLGLVEITRKKVRKSLREQAEENP